MENYTWFDPSYDLAAVSEPSADPVRTAGIRLLYPDDCIHCKLFNNEEELYDGFTSIEKWEGLTCTSHSSKNDSGDVSIMISAGPFDIAPYDSVTLAFAIIAGYGIENVIEASDAALSTYENQISGYTEVADNPEVNIKNRVYANYPNPFNQQTSITYSLPKQTHVCIEIFNITGKRTACILNRAQKAGEHRVFWDGRDEETLPVTSGVYICRLIFNHKEIFTKKMLLIR
jgi:hypothetical protein